MIYDYVMHGGIEVAVIPMGNGNKEISETCIHSEVVNSNYTVDGGIDKKAINEEMEKLLIKS